MEIIVINNNVFREKQIKRLRALVSEKRDFYNVDLHIHTNYSTDGTQTVGQAISEAADNKLDIISIADHDSILAYDEIVKQYGKDGPIIIPGVEFTVSYPEYEGRCHVLQYFYNTENQAFCNCINRNILAYRKRVHIWFERIENNVTLQHFFQQYKIDCTIKGYINFLNINAINMPDYTNIAKYIYKLLNIHGVNVWDVYERVIKDNFSDPCELRRERRTKELERFYHKYANVDITNNFRKLKPLLAPLNIDDADYPDYPSSGSLSIKEYGQLSIWEVTQSGVNILAHPDDRKLSCIESIGDRIAGVELNYRSLQDTNRKVYEKAKRLDMLYTIGSDKHVMSDNSYDDMFFYRMEYKNVLRLLALAEHT